MLDVFARGAETLWIDPAAALGEFKTWLYMHYLPVNFPKYVDRKVKQGIFPPSRADQLLLAVKRPALAH